MDRREKELDIFRLGLSKLRRARFSRQILGASELNRYEAEIVRSIFIAILIFPSFSIQANEAVFFGENAVIPDPVQGELIAASIEALVQDCSSAVKIDKLPAIDGQGVEVNFSTQSIEFNHPSVGNVTGVTKVIVRLWDNAEQNMGMDIYAISGANIYSLGKYSRLAYPIINMIKRPMPPNKSLQNDASEAGASE